MMNEDAIRYFKVLLQYLESCSNSVTIVPMLQLGNLQESQCNSWQKQKIFLITKVLRLTARPIQPLNFCVMGGTSPQVKQPVHKAGHSCLLQKLCMSGAISPLPNNNPGMHKDNLYCCNKTNKCTCIQYDFITYD